VKEETYGASPRAQIWKW